jgi:hypothetical protein
VTPGSREWPPYCRPLGLSWPCESSRSPGSPAARLAPCPTTAAVDNPAIEGSWCGYSLR